MSDNRYYVNSDRPQDTLLGAGAARPGGFADHEICRPCPAGLGGCGPRPYAVSRLASSLGRGAPI